jgi:hypothetical protein
MRRAALLAGVGVVLLAGFEAPGAEPPLELLTASYLGTGEDDDLQGGCVAPDGTIYVVGNTGRPARTLPGGVKPVTFGEAVDDARCGCAFVARLSGDGRTLLQYAQLAPGIAIFTTVEANRRGVYVGGYASAALEELLADRPGLLREYPLKEEARRMADGTLLEANGITDGKDPIAGRPGLGRQGAPCVLRFSADLARLDAGTYLEGWQQVWEKNRVAKLGQTMHGPFLEHFWQPTGVALLRGGDVVVGHDGGYFRLLTDEDKALFPLHERMPHWLSFYDVCDWVSRLSPDLSERRWQQAIYTPETNPEVARRIKPGWPHPHFSSPRTCRMRTDAAENVYLCGWSASATSQEPWWSPYLWKLDPRDGRPVWKLYHYDPMSGGGNRMGGNVSDTAVLTVAPERGGGLLSALVADGGNTVMGWGPRGAEGGKMLDPIRGHNFGVKLVHFWGQVHRVDGATRDGVGGARIGPWAWVVDLAPLPKKHVLTVGRYNDAFDFTPDAWHSTSKVENPNAFLRVYSPEFDLVFSTALPGFVPFEVAPLGGDRWLIVGRAETGAPPAGGGLQPKSAGKTDGFFLIVGWRDPKAS